jgi:hypothetical protein
MIKGSFLIWKVNKMRIFRRNDRVYASCSDVKAPVIDISDMPTKEFLESTKKEFRECGITAIRNKFLFPEEGQ